ncbi:hypothetical protein T260_13100 [Geobacillus thermopakistaniensis]|uniref:Uncharacterized protein n=1 Tax=Geobacillus thermopakistaniensis (strain MAS1) TaxID=1408282 RepID=A0A7U9J9K1_GEOTM|nr:hypothetical protein T260_13100 [Geobacillus sp. MAS1]
MMEKRRCLVMGICVFAFWLARYGAEKMKQHRPPLFVE